MEFAAAGIKNVNRKESSRETFYKNEMFNFKK